VQGLQKFGWTEGRNARFDIRWAEDVTDGYRRYSEELVELNPDVILASASPSVAALQRVTRSVPIVFANVADPVGAGYITSLARPGGNSTGFTAYEYSLSGKWLELLKEIAPNVTRVAVLRDAGASAGRRDGARNHRIRARAEWWFDRDRKLAGARLPEDVASACPLASRTMKHG
jgi:putative ABC transport system substrate-binding protein